MTSHFRQISTIYGSFSASFLLFVIVQIFGPLVCLGVFDLLLRFKPALLFL